MRWTGDNKVSEAVMTVILKPEQEHVVDEAIRAGLIETADQVVEVGIETIRQRLESTAPAGRSSQHHIDAAAERLLKFGEKHNFSLGGLTIKELVNEGRR
jgi:hypothetical protein